MPEFIAKQTFGFSADKKIENWPILISLQDKRCLANSTSSGQDSELSISFGIIPDFTQYGYFLFSVKESHKFDLNNNRGFDNRGFYLQRYIIYLTYSHKPL